MGARVRNYAMSVSVVVSLTFAGSFRGATAMAIDFGTRSQTTSFSDTGSEYGPAEHNGVTNADRVFVAHSGDLASDPGWSAAQPRDHSRGSNAGEFRTTTDNAPRSALAQLIQIGNPERVFSMTDDDFSSISNKTINYMDVTSDGGAVAFSTHPYYGNASLYVYQTDGQAGDPVPIRPTPDPDGITQTMRFSHDDTKLVFDWGGPETSSYDIWVTNADGSGALELIAGAGAQTFPCPAVVNGECRLLYRQGWSAMDLWSVDCTTGADSSRLTFEGNKSGPYASVDGTRIAFMSQNSTVGLDIFMMNSDGSDQREITSDGGTVQEAYPALANNHLGNEVILYLRNDPSTGNSGIWVTDLDGLQHKPLLAPQDQYLSRIDYVPNDPISSYGAIYYTSISGPGGVSEVWRAAVVARTPCPGAEVPQYMLGDDDDFIYEGTGSEDDVYSDSDWLDEVTTAYPGDEFDFDEVVPGGLIPFSFVFDIANGEYVAGASLTFRLKQNGGQPWETDFILFDQLEPTYLLFDLGWDGNPSVLTINLSDVLGDNLLPLLADGLLNCAVYDDAAIDYAILELHVAPSTWYVDDDTCPDPGTGAEADPFCSIQDAIDAACDGSTVLVAPGTYNETIDFIGKAITVQSSDGAGSTIIDGGGATVVICGSGEGRDTVLRGFTITGGASSLTSFGGGMRNDNGSSPTVLDCIFEGNVSTIDGSSDGGGMYNTANSSPLVIACTFRDNTAVGPNAQGGGMLNGTGCNSELVDCLFDANHAELEGGAILNFASNPIITNCTFVQNTAGTRAGGIASYPGVTGAQPTIVNSILWGNSAALGGESDQIYDEPGSSASVVTYTCIQGCATFCDNSADANIGADPQFVDIDGPDGVPGNEDDNLRLSSGSPCIDAADNTAVPPDTYDLDDDDDTTERTPLDLDGLPRFVDDPDTIDSGVDDLPEYPEVVDMGAYEYFPDCNESGTPDVCDLGCTALRDTCSLLADCGQSPDCNDNDIPDECELLGNDCNNNDIPDECEPDCQPNGIPDGCDVALGDPDGNGLVSDDCNNNSIPDECDPDFDGDTVPNSCEECPGADDRIDDNGNGFPDACDPLPPVAVPELIDWKKNRYLSFNPNNPDNPFRPDLSTAIQVTMTNSLFHPGAIGTLKWVGEPDADGFAVLSDTPVYRDWPEAVIYVTGCFISPVADYDVRATIQEIGDGNWFTDPLTLSTIDQPVPKYWGDVVGTFNVTEWTPPQHVTNIDDAVAAIKTFQEADNAPHVSITDVEPQEPNKIVNINDVFTIIRAFQGEPYPYGCSNDPCQNRDTEPCS